MSCLGPSYLPQPARAWTRFQPRCPDQLDIKAIKLHEDNILGATKKIPLSVKYRMPQYKKGNILQYKANSANFTKKQKYALMARGKWTNRNTTWATQGITYTNPNTKNLLRTNANYTVITSDNNPVETDAIYVNINCPPSLVRKVYSELPTNAGDNLDPSKTSPVPPEPSIPGGNNPIMPPLIVQPSEPTDTIVEVGGEMICNTVVNPCTGEIYTAPNKDDCFPTSDSDVPGKIEFLCWNDGLNTWYPKNKTTYATSGNKWPYNYKGFACGSISADNSPILSYETSIEYSSEITLSWVFNSISALADVFSISVYENDYIIETVLPTTTSTTVDNLETGVIYNFFITTNKSLECNENTSNIINYYIPFPKYILFIEMIDNLIPSPGIEIIDDSNISPFYLVINWEQVELGGCITGYKLYVNNTLLVEITDFQIKKYEDYKTLFISGALYYYSLSSFSPGSTSIPVITSIVIPFPVFEIYTHIIETVTLIGAVNLNIQIQWRLIAHGGSISRYNIYRNGQYIASVIDTNQYIDIITTTATALYIYTLTTTSADNVESDFSESYSISIP